MGTVIDFIEKLGASADLQHLTEAQALQLLQQRFDIALTGALHADIAAELDARKNLVCGVFAAEEGDDDIDTVTAEFIPTVESMLDARKNLVCGVAAAEEGDDETVTAGFVPAIEAMLDIRSNVVCAVCVPENDEELVEKVA